jgi:integrase
MNVAALVVSAPSSAELAQPLDPQLVALSAELAAVPQARATARAYAGDWARFEAWCQSHGLPALPASEGAIRTYLVQLAAEGRRHSTIARAYAAIRAHHRDGGHALPTLPTVTNALRNLGRTLGTAPKQKAPMLADTLRRVTKHDDDAPLAVRDRAMLLLGFAAALRRSEIVGLDVGDVAFTEDGVEVTIRRSKTDQAGAGRKVGVPFGRKGSCPVRALRRWLETMGSPNEGPLFRPVNRAGRIGAARLRDQAVARAVKRAAALAGLDPASFAGHSLRSGLATSAAKAGKGLDVIMQTTGHRSERVAMGYIRHGSLFDACASEGLL